MDFPYAQTFRFIIVHNLKDEKQSAQSLGGKNQIRAGIQLSPLLCLCIPPIPQNVRWAWELRHWSIGLLGEEETSKRCLQSTPSLPKWREGSVSETVEQWQWFILWALEMVLKSICRLEILFVCTLSLVLGFVSVFLQRWFLPRVMNV